jgi:hypothetical protein
VAGDEKMVSMVLVKALVQSLETQQVCRGTRLGNGAFALPSQCWGVIGARGDRPFSNVERVGQHIFMYNGGEKLKITVGNSPFGVVKGD